MNPVPTPPNALLPASTSHTIKESVVVVGLQFLPATLTFNSLAFFVNPLPLIYIIYPIGDPILVFSLSIAGIILKAY